MLVVVLVVPALLGRGRIPESFDFSAVEKLQAADPDIVFLGNSLLDNRIDPELLTELTGLRTVSMAIDGTGPGVWLLQLANIVGASANRPDTIFIFFHDDLITRDISFTGPKDTNLIQQLTHRASGTIYDPETDTYQHFQRFGLSKQKTIGELIHDGILWSYPLTESSSSSDRNPIVSLGAGIAGMSYEEAANEAETTFAFANKRDQAAEIQQPKYHGSFDSKIDDSYLSALIGQADNLDIELIIVRTAARPNDDGTPNEPAKLAKYSTDLSEYLDSQNIRYIDMTGHDGNDAGMYYDGYHLKRRFRSYYTEIFADWLLTEIDGSAHP